MWRTIDIVPSSIRNDPQVQAACECIDRQLSEMYAAPEGIPSICFWPQVDQQVPPLLDILAWEMHADTWAGWDGELSIEKKIELINKSIDWHRHKGTVYAVEEMLKTVFRKGTVQEWYEYGGRPYYFRVVLNEPFDAERWNRAYAGILAVKNVRSWMEAMAMPDKSIPAQMYVSVRIGQRIKETFIPMSTNPDTTP